MKDEDCVADNSYCSGVCYCQSGYINSFNGTSCLSGDKTNSSFFKKEQRRELYSRGANKMGKEDLVPLEENGLIKPKKTIC